MFRPNRRSDCHWLPLALLLVSPSLCAQEKPAAKVLAGHTDAVMMGAFTPDGNAVTASFDKTVRLWDVDGQKELRQYAQHTGPVFSLAVSGDGTTLITGAQDNTVRVWDLPLGKPLRTFRHAKRVNAIALDAGGNTLVSASEDHRVQIYAVSENDSQTSSRSAHDADVLSVAYRSDGAYFATGDVTGRVLLWSPYLDEPQGEFLSHDGAVSHLQFASNNQQLFSAGDDGFVRQWQVPSSSPKRIEVAGVTLIDWSLAGSQSEVVCVADEGKAFVLDLSSGKITNQYLKQDFRATAIAHAPNHTWLCIADESGKAHLLNYNDGQPRGVVAGHRGSIHDVAIHPDSVRFATCGADGTVRVWGQPPPDQEPLEPLQLFQSDSDGAVAANCVAFTPDQSHIVCGFADGKIRQWNLANGDLVRTIDAAHRDSNTGVIRDLVITPGGETILTIGDDQTLRAWNLKDGSAGKTFPHPVTIRRVAVSPDGTRAAVACEDGLVRIWDLKSGWRLQSLSGHSAPAIALGFLADGRSIVSAALHGTVHVSKTAILGAVPIHERAVRSLSLYGGGSQLLTCGDDGRIVMTNAANGSQVRQYRVAERPSAAPPGAAQPDTAYRHIKPQCVTIRSDNQRVAAGTDDGDVFVWNTNNGESPLLALAAGSPVTAVSYSGDNQKLAVATAAGEVHVFGPSIPGSQPQVELTRHQHFVTDEAVTQVKFAPDNRSLWVSLDDGQVQRWNYAGISMRRQMNHGGAVYGVEVSRNGNLAISCSTDQTVRVWDTTTGQQKFQLRGHAGAVHAIALSPDETFAVTSGADGTLRLWDIVGGRQLKQLTKFDSTMYSIAIHPDGQWIAAAGADREVHLLDMISGEEHQTLKGHSDYIHGVAFDPSGNRLLSYGYAGYLKIWDVIDGDLLHESRIGKVGNHARFSSDGKRILLSNGDGTARVIPAP